MVTIGSRVPPAASHIKPKVKLRHHPAPDAFDATISDLIGRYRDGRTPDFPTASLASMFAGSLAMLPLHAAPRTARRRCCGGHFGAC
jgi:hypothetical protein